MSTLSAPHFAKRLLAISFSIFSQVVKVVALTWGYACHKLINNSNKFACHIKNYVTI